MASVSDKPWSDFSQADYTAQQWHSACLINMEPAAGQDPDVKDLHKVPVREPDGTLNSNAVHAAAGAHGIAAVDGLTAPQREAAAKALVGLYGEIGDKPPASLLALAGTARARQSAPQTYQRVFVLDGIEILSRAKGGDGRTVEAYAAVFNAPAEIHDAHGDYIETVDPAAFARTINGGAARRAQVLLNHGYDPQGKTGGLQQTPLGHPVDIKADSRGLLTVSRYNDSPLAEQVLAGIRNQDYTAQSFEGPIYRSDPQRAPGRARPGTTLPKVRRLELGLRNYGPTMTPYYPDAAITAVRSIDEIAHDFAALDAEQREELIRTLSTTPGWDPETAAILATPHRGPGAEDPRDEENAHSARQKLLRIRAELAFNGVS